MSWLLCCWGRPGAASRLPSSGLRERHALDPAQEGAPSPHEQQQQHRARGLACDDGAAASTRGQLVEQEGWSALPAELLALIFGALQDVRTEQRGCPASGTITLGTAAALLAACSPCRHWRHTALETLAVHLRIRTPDELDSPLLSTLRCAGLAFQPRTPPALQQQLAAQLSSLLRGRDFWLTSGGTLSTLRNLPGEALMWRQELSPYAALREVGFDAGSSWLSLQSSMLGAAGCLGRFQHVRIAARSVSIFSISPDPPPLPPVGGDEGAWALPRFLAALEPALQGSAICSLTIEAHYALVALTPAPGPNTRVLLSRNLQQPTLGIVLSVPAQPAHWDATHGCLSASFTRPAPGNNDAVLVCVHRRV